MVSWWNRCKAVWHHPGCSRNDPCWQRCELEKGHTGVHKHGSEYWG